MCISRNLLHLASQKRLILCSPHPYLRFSYSFQPRAESATFLFATMDTTEFDCSQAKSLERRQRARWVFLEALFNVFIPFGHCGEQKVIAHDAAHISTDSERLVDVRYPHRAVWKGVVPGPCSHRTHKMTIAEDDDSTAMHLSNSQDDSMPMCLSNRSRVVFSTCTVNG